MDNEGAISPRESGGEGPPQQGPRGLAQPSLPERLQQLPTAAADLHEEQTPDREDKGRVEADPEGEDESEPGPSGPTTPAPMASSWTMAKDSVPGERLPPLPESPLNHDKARASRGQLGRSEIERPWREAAEESRRLDGHRPRVKPKPSTRGGPTHWCGSNNSRAVFQSRGRGSTWRRRCRRGNGQELNVNKLPAEVQSGSRSWTTTQRSYCRRPNK